MAKKATGERSQSGLHAEHSTRGRFKESLVLTRERAAQYIYISLRRRRVIMRYSWKYLLRIFACSGWLVNFLLWQTERFDKKPSVSGALLSDGSGGGALFATTQ